MAIAGELVSSRVSPERVNRSQVWNLSQNWLPAISTNQSTPRETGGNEIEFIFSVLLAWTEIPWKQPPPWVHHRRFHFKNLTGNLKGFTFQIYPSTKAEFRMAQAVYFPECGRRIGNA